MEGGALAVDSARIIVRIAFLAALATSISTLETLIPRPLPWLRLGLANVMVLTGIIFLGLRAGLFITLLKSILSSVLSRTFPGPGFLLSLSAGVGSTLVMWSGYRLLTPALTLAGVSVLGAVSHNLVQLALAYLVFLRSPVIFYLIPVMVLLAIPAGITTGYFAHRLALLLRRRWKPPPGGASAVILDKLYGRLV